MINIPEFPTRAVTRVLTCVDSGVTYHICDRTDIEISAPAYLYQFNRTDTTRVGELTHFIISHENADSAIEWFGCKYFRYEAYTDASFIVERIGIDFDPYREVPLVIGY